MKDAAAVVLFLLGLVFLAAGLLHAVLAAVTGRERLAHGRTAALWIADAAGMFAVLDLLDAYWQGAAVLAGFTVLAVLVSWLLGRRERDGAPG